MEKQVIKVGQETQTESVLWRLNQETHTQLNFTFTEPGISLHSQKRMHLFWKNNIILLVG